MAGYRGVGGKPAPYFPLRLKINKYVVHLVPKCIVTRVVCQIEIHLQSWLLKLLNTKDLTLKSKIKQNIRHGGQSSPILSKMAAEPAREWSDEQLKSDDLPKKDIIKFIQDNAAHSVRSSPSFHSCFLLSNFNNQAELSPKNAARCTVS